MPHMLARCLEQPWPRKAVTASGLAVPWPMWCYGRCHYCNDSGCPGGVNCTPVAYVATVSGIVFETCSPTDPAFNRTYVERAGQPVNGSYTLLRPNSASLCGWYSTRQGALDVTGYYVAPPRCTNVSETTSYGIIVVLALTTEMAGWVRLFTPPAGTTVFWAEFTAADWAGCLSTLTLANVLTEFRQESWYNYAKNGSITIEPA